MTANHALVAVRTGPVTSSSGVSRSICSDLNPLGPLQRQDRYADDRGCMVSWMSMNRIDQ